MTAQVDTFRNIQGGHSVYPAHQDNTPQPPRRVQPARLDSSLHTLRVNASYAEEDTSQTKKEVYVSPALQAYILMSCIKALLMDVSNVPKAGIQLQWGFRLLSYAQGVRLGVPLVFKAPTLLQTAQGVK